MIPRTPSHDRVDQAPPRRVGKPQGGPPHSGKPRQGGEKDQAIRKKYIKEFALHRVLSDSMSQCLKEMPEDPCLFLAMRLMEAADARGGGAPNPKWDALRVEANELRGVIKCASTTTPASTPAPAPLGPGPAEAEGLAGDAAPSSSSTNCLSPADSDLSLASCGASQHGSEQRGVGAAGPGLPSPKAEARGVACVGYVGGQAPDLEKERHAVELAEQALRSEREQLAQERQELAALRKSRVSVKHHPPALSRASSSSSEMAASPRCRKALQNGSGDDTAVVRIPSGDVESCIATPASVKVASPLKGSSRHHFAEALDGSKGTTPGSGMPISRSAKPSSSMRKQSQIQEFRSQLQLLSSHALISLEELVSALAPSWKTVETWGLGSFTSLFYSLLKQRCDEASERFSRFDLQYSSAAEEVVVQSEMLRSIADLMADPLGSAVVVHNEWRRLSHVFQPCLIRWEHYVAAAECFIEAVSDVNNNMSGFLDSAHVSAWLRLFAAMAQVIHEEHHIVAAENSKIWYKYSASVRMELAETLSYPVQEMIRIGDCLDTIDEDELAVYLAAKFRDMSFGRPHNASHLASICVSVICGIRDATFLGDCVRIIPWAKALKLSHHDCESLGPVIHSFLSCPSEQWFTLWKSISIHLSDSYGPPARRLHVPPAALLAVEVHWRCMRKKDGFADAIHCLPSGPSVYACLAACVQNLSCVDRIHEALLALKEKGSSIAPRHVPVLWSLIQTEMVKANEGTAITESAGVGWSALWGIVVHCISDSSGALEGSQVGVDAKAGGDVCFESCLSMWESFNAETRGHFASALASNLGLTAYSARVMHLLLQSFFTAGHQCFRRGASSALRDDSFTHTALTVQTLPTEQVLIHAVETGLSNTPHDASAVSRWASLLEGLPFSTRGNLKQTRDPPVKIPMFAYPLITENADEMVTAITAALDDTSVAGASAALSKLFSQKVATTIKSALKHAVSVLGCEVSDLITAIRKESVRLGPEGQTAYEILAETLDTLSLQRLPSRLSLSFDVSKFDASTGQRHCVAQPSGLKPAELDLIHASWNRMRIKGCIIEVLFLHASLSLPELRVSPLMFKLHTLSELAHAVLSQISPTTNPERLQHLKRAVFKYLYELGMKPHYLEQILASVFPVIYRFDPGVCDEVTEAWGRALQVAVFPSLETSLMPGWKMSSVVASVLECPSYNHTDFVNDVVALYEERCAERKESAADTPRSTASGEDTLDPERKGITSEDVRSVCLLMTNIALGGYSSGAIQVLNQNPLCLNPAEFSRFESGFLTLFVKYGGGDQEVQDIWERTFTSVRVLLPRLNNAPPEPQPATAISGSDAIAFALTQKYWQDMAQVKHVVIAHFYVGLKRDHPLLGAVWDHLPLHEVVDRFIWLIDTMFLSEALRNSLLHCAGERWQREGVIDSVFSRIPTALISSFHHFNPRMNKVTERAWLLMLNSAQEIMASTVIGKVLKPPTSQEVAALLRTVHISPTVEERFQASLKLLDPNCPHDASVGAVSIAVDSLEECRSASNDLLLLLPPADPTQAHRIWAIVQALASCLPGKGEPRTNEGETTWRKLFLYRIAPQLIWSMERVQTRNGSASASQHHHPAPGPALGEVSQLFLGMCVFAQEYYRDRCKLEANFWSCFQHAAGIHPAKTYVDLLQSVEHNGGLFTLLGKIASFGSEWACREGWLQDSALCLAGIFDASQVGEMLESLGRAFTLQLSGMKKALAAAHVDASRLCAAVPEVLEIYLPEAAAAAVRCLTTSSQIYQSLEQGAAPRLWGKVASGLSECLSPAQVRFVCERWADLDKTRYLQGVQDHLARLSPTTSAALSTETLTKLAFTVLDEAVKSTEPAQGLFQQVAEELALSGMTHSHFNILMCSIVESMMDLQFAELSENGTDELDELRDTWVAGVAAVVGAVRTLLPRNLVPFRERLGHLQRVLQRVKHTPTQWTDVSHSIESYISSISHTETINALRIIHEAILCIGSHSPLEPVLGSVRDVVHSINEDAVIQIGDTLGVLKDTEPLLDIWCLLIATAVAYCPGDATPTHPIGMAGSASM